MSLAVRFLDKPQWRAVACSTNTSPIISVGWLVGHPFFKISSEHCLSQTVKARELKLWEDIHPLPCVTCHMSYVTCQVSLNFPNVFNDSFDFFYLTNLLSINSINFWLTWPACWCAINKELSSSKTTVLLCLVLGKEKLKTFFWQIRAISSFLINLLNTRKRKGPIYLYCGLWLEEG